MPQTQTTPSVGRALHINPSLLALKPRQVSLLFNNSKMSPAINSPAVLKPHQKSILLRTIALYLQRSGYSKTLKKFRSEASLQIDNSEGSALDLEEIICKFLEISHQGRKKPETLTFNDRVSAEVEKSGENDREIKHRQSGAIIQSVSSEIVDEGKSRKTTELESNRKSKEKRSKRGSSNLATDNCEAVSEDTKELDSNMEFANDIVERSGKARGTKKKKNSPVPQKLSSINAEKDALKVLETVDPKKLNNESKKRKRVSSQKVTDQPDGGEPLEEAAEILPNTEHKPKSKPSIGTSDNTQMVESNGQVIAHDVPASGYLDKKEQKAKTPKSTKKEQNCSAEPTTAQRFQRVKADDVVFSDERLKDNSYWAKDGAENGYGAKAQEVLGQVKGKGFRHEKTKKKRGSYRGGQIDLQTHSVKFNYSDEE